jgi:hypothetical protein
VKIHGMDDWKPRASALVAVNADNITIILAEKEAAVREAAALPGILEMDRLGLEAELAAELREMLDLYGYYVEGFSHCARVCYLTRLAAQTSGDLRARRFFEKAHCAPDRYGLSALCLLAARPPPA